MRNIIVIIASVISLSCLVYSDIQLKKCEKYLDEINEMIDEQKQECFKETENTLKQLMKEVLEEDKK